MGMGEFNLQRSMFNVGRTKSSGVIASPEGTEGRGNLGISFLPLWGDYPESSLTV